MRHKPLVGVTENCTEGKIVRDIPVRVDKSIPDCAGCESTPRTRNSFQELLGRIFYESEMVYWLATTTQAAIKKSKQKTRTYAELCI